MTKLVVAQPADWAEIERDLLDPGLINRRHIVLMPAAGSLSELLACNQMVARLCIEQQVRMCTRLHVEVWNQLTGV